ncbi:MAG: hypothetical protein HFI74_11100 [Lachnospiraceae bacterium]|jgi:hypothetical protein|nr:hypothetical protein [Lachnospiraceae bacterium]
MELYYYTTTETMKLIIEGGNIHATNVGYLNDSDEYINGLREIKGLLEKANQFDFSNLQDMAKSLGIGEKYPQFKAESSNIYSISFSKAEDLLSQWHMYSRESGVQIKMVFDEQKKYYYNQDDENKEKAELKKRQVHYLTKSGMPSNEYLKEGKRVLTEFQELLVQNDGDMIGIWKVMAPFIKNYGFKQEDEVRAIVISDETKLQVGYRSDKGVLKPYLDIKMEKGWPICGIMVGPGRNQNQVFRSICHFLDHAKLKIDKAPNEKVVKEYFCGMKEYLLPEDKILKCMREVLNLDRALLEMGVTYSEKIQETLRSYFTDEKERIVVENYMNNNYFCNKGIIVNKSKLPYEF